MTEIDYQRDTQIALLAVTDEELDSAGALFETMMEDLRNKNFSAFDQFSELAIFLAKDFWPSQGMFMEPSSQLFVEYEIGAVEWIWEEAAFRRTLPRYLEVDIHFGCFVLTENRADANFIAAFSPIALSQECEICSSTGEGWISPPAYVAEDPNTSADLLQQYFDRFYVEYTSKKDWRLPYDDSFPSNYESVAVLRSLASNPNLPRRALEVLAEVRDKSLLHETRMLLSGADEKRAEGESFIDWAARHTLGEHRD